MDTVQRNISIASLILVLWFPPLVLNHLSKNLLSRSLDGFHYIFIQAIFLLSLRNVVNLTGLVRELFTYLANLKNHRASDRISSINNNTSQGIPPPQVKREPTNSQTNKYAKETSNMLKRMLELTEQQPDASDSSWHLVYRDEKGDLSVYRNPSISDYCYKVSSIMDNTPETTFDFMLDVEKRIEWDDTIESIQSIEEIDPFTKVQYLLLRGMFPTSQRDICTLGYSTKLDDGRMVTVNQSVVHELCPERRGIVRLQVECAGFVVEPITSQPNKCRLIQIADGDPKGWIPKSIVKLISTKALPASIRKLNKILATMPPQDISYSLSPSLLPPDTQHRTPRPNHSPSKNHPRGESSNGLVGQPGKSSWNGGMSQVWRSLIQTVTEGGTIQRKFFVVAAYAFIIIAGTRTWLRKKKYDIKF